MPVSYTATIGTTDFGFDWFDSEIEVEDGVSDATAEDIKLACREAEASEQGMVFPQIATTFNPVQLTATSLTFLNVILADPWKILTLLTTGTFSVGDGNVVSETDGVAIFAENPAVTNVNNTSSAGVLVVSGSGVLESDVTDIANAVAAKILPEVIVGNEINGR